MTQTAESCAAPDAAPAFLARLVRSRSRNLKHLWIARMIVHFVDSGDMAKGCFDAEQEKFGWLRPDAVPR